MPKVTIHTDGAYCYQTEFGGWAAILECGEVVKELFGADPCTTNNRMEMTAVIKGLQALTKPCDVLVRTDSKYVMDGATKWIKRWNKNGFKTAKGSPVKNFDLWSDLSHLMVVHNVEFEHVFAHNGNPKNERADELAVRARVNAAERSNE